MGTFCDLVGEILRQSLSILSVLSFIMSLAQQILQDQAPALLTTRSPPCLLLSPMPPLKSQALAPISLQLTLVLLEAIPVLHLPLYPSGPSSRLTVPENHSSWLGLRPQRSLVPLASSGWVHEY